MASTSCSGFASRSWAARAGRISFAVVHGHTPLGPEVFSHRIGIDSGCFYSDVLTAVELADNRLRFHGVAGTPDLRPFRDGCNPDQPRAFTEPVPVRPWP